MSRKNKIQDFLYRQATNVEHEMFNYTGKDFEATPGKRSTDSIQKTAVLGTSHIIRKVPQYET